MKTKTKQKILEDALMGFRHTMTSALVEEAKSHGWSLSHFEVIQFIAEHGNPSTKDIAIQLHITPPSASTLVDTLVTKGLVVRGHTDEDRRAIRVTLAPRAQKILSAIYKKKSSIFTTLLSRINDDDKEEFARILRQCIIK